MRKKIKRAPELKTEKEVDRFWTRHDSTDFVDWTEAKRVLFPNLRPTTRPIPLRLPVYVIDRVKILAHKKDIPYQSLVKLYIEQGVAREFHATGLKK